MPDRHAEMEAINTVMNTEIHDSINGPDGLKALFASALYEIRKAYKVRLRGDWT